MMNFVQMSRFRKAPLVHPPLVHPLVHQAQRPPVLFPFISVPPGHYRITWADAIRAHDEALLTGGAPGILNRSAIESAIARRHHGPAPDQGSTTFSPVPSKSRTLRVTRVAPRERDIAAIWKSASPIGRPVRRRSAAISA